jgi:hypothetical protein
MSAPTITGSQVLSIDTADKVFQLTSKALGIIDIIGHIGPNAEIDDHSLNSATWAVKDMIREIQQIVEDLPRVDAVSQ